MTKRIFRGIFFVSIITMLLSIVFIIGVQYQFYSESQLSSLKNEAYYISNIIDDNSEYLESIKKSEDRITLIDSDGTVLFDNRYDVSLMQNHSDRKEIKEAMENGSGYSVRFSETLSRKTCYYALKLDDGNVLRLSNSRASIFSTVMTLLSPLCAIIIASVILSYVLASIISKKLLKPINEMDIEKPIIEESYEELSPIIRKINAQNRKIRAQISALTQSQREFEIISDNMSEGLILTDKNGRILTHNKSVEQIFSVTENPDGENILELNRSESFREIFTSLRDGKRVDTTTETDGKIYEITLNPVFNDDGSLCGSVILIIDITEKENRERLRREFTANVSHELKTPLTSIYGISDMLKSGMVEKEDIKGFASDINKESERLITLVDDIIELSKLDEGTLQYDNTEVNLGETATEVCRSLSVAAEQKNVTVNMDLGNAVINAPYNLIFEMIYNLCDNAIKYNKDSGTVTVKTGTADGKPFVTVSDTGIGIPSADISRIYERFYRVDKSHSKKIGGTGLGLSIVKHIASLTGGTISTESKAGAGTTITVQF